MFVFYVENDVFILFWCCVVGMVLIYGYVGNLVDLLYGRKEMNMVDDLVVLCM